MTSPFSHAPLSGRNAPAVTPTFSRVPLIDTELCGPAHAGTRRYSANRLGAARSMVMRTRSSVGYSVSVTIEQPGDHVSRDGAYRFTYTPSAARKYALMV